MTSAPDPLLAEIDRLLDDVRPGIWPDQGGEPTYAELRNVCEEWYALTKRARDLIERLAAQLAEAQHWRGDFQEACRQREEAQEQARKNAQDAERYRWLRDIGDATWTPLSLRGQRASQVDDHIDAARAGGEHGPREGDGKEGKNVS